MWCMHMCTYAGSCEYLFIVPCELKKNYSSDLNGLLSLQFSSGEESFSPTKLRPFWNISVENSFSNSYLSIATDIKKYQFSQIALV